MSWIPNTASSPPTLQKLKKQEKRYLQETEDALESAEVDDTIPSQDQGSGSAQFRLHAGRRRGLTRVHLPQLLIQPRLAVQVHKRVQRRIEVQINVEDPVLHLGHLLRDAQQLIRHVDSVGGRVDQLDDEEADSLGVGEQVRGGEESLADVVGL